MAVSMRKQIAQNKRKTYLTMLLFAIFLATICYLISFIKHNYEILIWGSIVVLIYILVQYFASTRLMLIASGAHGVKKHDDPRFVRMLTKISEDAKIPKPRAYIVDDSAPNLIVAGRTQADACIMVTTGLLEISNDKELNAAICYGVQRIKNYSMQSATILFGLFAFTAMIADFGLRILYASDQDDEENSPVGMLIYIITLILSPFILPFVKMSVSRCNDYQVDQAVVSMLGGSGDLISLLERLREQKMPMQQQNIIATSLYMLNPLKISIIGRLFVVHPTLESRIERLENAKK